MLKSASGVNFEVLYAHRIMQHNLLEIGKNLPIIFLNVPPNCKYMWHRIVYFTSDKQETISFLQDQ